MGLRGNLAEITHAQSLETGRRLDESVAYLSLAILQTENYITEALSVLAPKRIASGLTDRLLSGPTAFIVPLNYPLAIALQTIPALLMSVSGVVWKPSEKTPLSWVALVRELGLP